MTPRHSGIGRLNEFALSCTILVMGGVQLLLWEPDGQLLDKMTSIYVIHHVLAGCAETLILMHSASVQMTKCMCQEAHLSETI